MTLQQLLDLILQAMQVDFTVFGYTIDLYGFFVFSVVFSVAAWFIRRLM